jgi:DNA-binding IclR family transcriptional regulator
MSSDRKTDYTNEAQQRILRLVVLLAGNEFNGLAPAEIAKAMSVSAAIVTRDLDNLRTAGVADQIPDTGRWRLGPKLVQIGLAFATHLDKQRQLVDDLATRYTRQP